MTPHLPPTDDDALDLDFLIDDEPVEAPVLKKPYKVLIVDDESEMHTTTKMVLKSFTFEGRRLEIIDAYSGAEAMVLLKAHPDLALIMLDVVMEENDSGLKVVDYIRHTLNNKRIRIILRTGHPGEAPEERVISEYDINDYRLKTELTVQRLYTSLYEALRSYRDIMALEHHRSGLEKIIAVSSALFHQGSVSEFYNCVLEQMMFFREDDTTLYFRERIDRNGLIICDEQCYGVVIAATGRFKTYIGKPVKEIDELNAIYDKACTLSNNGPEQVIETDSGFLVCKTVHGSTRSYIYVEGTAFTYDLELIRTFLAHYSMALDNYLLHQSIITAQGEVIVALGDLIEKRPLESTGHVDRVSRLSVWLADRMGMTTEEKLILRTASLLHDTGKACVPDALLTKPGRLTPEEFTLVSRHAKLGSLVYSHSALEVLRWATLICRHHHEHFDGSGYPDGLTGKDIPLAARIVALADVLDALTHASPARAPWPPAEAFAYIQRHSGDRFDPMLVEIVLKEPEAITGILLGSGENG